ncbi:unnamed protein product [Arabidopsis arenosa]|uniref:Uncharacterized protein n=1 Tax=Arabidopsis arenosa TaxID=38785 RepID=A0A8S2B014_ARAAE|nr:unnamed protein product [Arabidopsis arenosa]
MKLKSLMLASKLWIRNCVLSTSFSTLPYLLQTEDFIQLSAWSIREPLSASSSFSLFMTKINMSSLMPRT